MITHVAIKVQGKLYSLPAPNRHHDLIRLAIESGEPKPIDGHGENSGFLDDEGHFLNRNTAGAVAFKCGPNLRGFMVIATIIILVMEIGEQPRRDSVGYFIFKRRCSSFYWVIRCLTSQNVIM